MSENMMAPCGLNCARCDIFVATQADSDILRSQVANKWSAMFHYNFGIEDINCDGCLGGGRMAIYCRSMCEVKPCATSRGITRCEDCPDFLCEALRKNREASSQYTP